MSTLRVSNIEAKADASSPTIDEKVKVTSSQGRVLVQIDGKTAGITSIGINTTSTSFTIDVNQNVQFVGVITAANVNTTGISTFTSLNVTGNLGIGNTNPGAKLDVTGDIRLSGDDPEIEFNNGGARIKGRMNALSIHSGSGFNSDSEERVRINSTGVGIGTTNPDKKLVVYGSGGNFVAEFTNTNNASSNNGVYISVQNTASATQVLNVSSGGNNTLLVRGDGNVTKPLQSFCDTGGTNSYNAAQSLVSSPASAKGNWSSTTANVGNNFSTSTDLYTCPVAGVYAVSCTCFGDNYNSGSGGRVIFVLSFNGNYEEITEINSVYENQSPCILRKLSANDTIGLGINGTGGSDFHVRLQVYFLG